MANKLIDHLFRHQYGKMVSILTNIFGLSNLEIIEDAVQDIFITAMVKWRKKMPDNPEAWLMASAKNRVIDLLRKVKADNDRVNRLRIDPSIEAIDDMFLDHEIEDSQLRMIFTACHPSLNPKDQIAFALKSIAGFSANEIASALLLKVETVKKRLQRARKTIQEQNVTFSIPPPTELKSRLARVYEVIYLIFNEGFHSNNRDALIKSELCGEAIRLNKMIIKKESLRNGTGYALFSLLCFQASRLESKMTSDNQIIDLRSQDRSLWYIPMIELGREAMYKSLTYEDYSTYHIEGAIALEHLDAPSFEKTNWDKILALYRILEEKNSSTLSVLNVAFVLLQMERNDEALKKLESINPDKLEQRSYLYYGTKAEYYTRIGENRKAIECLDIAIESANNQAEKKYLSHKKKELEVS